MARAAEQRAAWRRLTPALALAALGFAATAAACNGPQSALDPAGRDAERIASLFWWMAGGAVMVWAGVTALAVYAVHARRERISERSANLLIAVGGAALPTGVLSLLVAYGLYLIPVLRPPAGGDGLVIHVSGEQWWWRVRYEPEAGEPVELANEIRLPLGRRTELRLTSPDVVHSFWIPALAGKMDMIPGRETQLLVEPTRTGIFRGVCAEYCGTAHALMAFPVVVLEPPAFEAWLAGQRAPAREPQGALLARGREAFVENGCGACHTVRGTPARGRVGPDLSHVGSRLTLGAGTLDPGVDALRLWLEATGAVKPGVHMPAFGMLPPDELAALAAYLESLR